MKLLTCILLHAGICFNTLSQTNEELITRGKKEFASGNYSASLVLFDKVLRSDPAASGINFLAGLSEFNSGHFEKAESYFSLEIKNNAAFEKAYLFRAKANKHSFDQAFDDLQKAASLNASDPQVFLTRGDLLFENKMYERAFADYAMLLKLNIRNTDEAFYKMAVCKYYLKDAVAACELWQKVNDPDDFEDYEEINKICNK